MCPIDAVYTLLPDYKYFWFSTDGEVDGDDDDDEDGEVEGGGKNNISVKLHLNTCYVLLAANSLRKKNLLGHVTKQKCYSIFYPN